MSVSPIRKETRYIIMLKPIERKHVTDGSPCWCYPIRQKWNPETQQWVEWDEETQTWINVNTENTTTTNKD